MSIPPPDAVNVKDYGATGLGKTNDQPYIQKALLGPQLANVGSVGTVVYFPAGTYRVEAPIKVHASGVAPGGVFNLGIRLHPAATIQFAYTGSGRRALFEVSGDCNGGMVVIEGGCLRGNSLASIPQDCVQVAAAPVIIRDALITSFSGSGVLIVANASVQEGSSATLENCHVLNNGAEGVVAQPGVRLLVRSCVVSGNGRWGLRLSGNSVTVVSSMIADNGRSQPDMLGNCLLEMSGAGSPVTARLEQNRFATDSGAKLLGLKTIAPCVDVAGPGNQVPGSVVITRNTFKGWNIGTGLRIGWTGPTKGTVVSSNCFAAYQTGIVIGPQAKAFCVGPNAFAQDASHDVVVQSPAGPGSQFRWDKAPTFWITY
jgi:hypothetical protein